MSRSWKLSKSLQEGVKVNLAGIKASQQNRVVGLPETTSHPWPDDRLAGVDPRPSFSARIR
jgi:hypothetical protein